MARDFAIRNPERLLKNMVIIRDILARNGIPCWLHYGTCLGAVRERNFIPHDDDADMGIYAKDYGKLLSLIPELEKAELIRIQDDDWGDRMVQFVNRTEKVTGNKSIFFVRSRSGCCSGKNGISAAG